MELKKTNTVLLDNGKQTMEVKISSFKKALKLNKMAKKSTTASNFVTIEKGSANQVSKTKSVKNDTTILKPKKFEVKYQGDNTKAILNRDKGTITIRKKAKRDNTVVNKKGFIGLGKTLPTVKKLKKSTTLYDVMLDRAAFAFNMPTKLLCSEGDVITYLKSIKL